MNLLQFFFIISGIIILILAIDVSKKQKFNALHFVVFFLIWLWLLIFTVFPNILDAIWKIFWVARWADVLVYSSIVFLSYFVLLLLSKHIENKDSITDLVRELAIENSIKEGLTADYVFIIPAYNEGSHVYNTIKSIRDKWYTDIIVVNDWSRMIQEHI